MKRVCALSSSRTYDILAPMDYSLTVQEEALAAKVGWARQNRFLARPEANRNYSEGDVWEAFQHMICAGSEIAFARMLGIKDFVPSENTYKTELDIPGFGEVRYAFPPNFPEYSEEVRGLRMTSRDSDELIYVLLAGGLGKKTKRYAPEWLGAPYVALGWMYGAEVKCEKWRFNEQTFYAPRTQLRKMSTLDMSAKGADGYQMTIGLTGLEKEF